MAFIAAFKLFGFAISAALQISLLTLIKRERKLDKLEVLFLSLIACLFVWNFGNFLLLLFPETSSELGRGVLTLVVAPLTFGILGFLPSLLLHVHLVFQQKVLPKPILTVSRTLESAIYLPLLFLPIVLIVVLVVVLVISIYLAPKIFNLFRGVIARARRVFA